ncbi:SMP-30/gluconolactonase/LRE family protein [Celeribacter sp.]|uniref:SMP-30/gluconolactonase/LRE family protein n=1 Tax=Celeribacter sp. TaxID=1890673 RepID=UPI003A90D823
MTKFEIRDPRFSEVISKDAELTVVADGFGFTEGPIWHPTEHWLAFSDIQESHQYRWSEKDGVSILRTPSNQANGNFFDREGRIVSCEHASSQMVRHEHDGKLVRVLASHYDGKELNSPNDVVVDSLNRVWFTDPSFGRIRENLGIIRDQDLNFQGVYRLDPDGELVLVTSALTQPNGLCFSPDEQTLFVNDSFGPTIHAFTVNADGNLSGGDVWTTVSGEGEGVPDGMKTDMHGRIFCNGPGGVHVFSPEADCLGVILIPEKSTNFCFGGPDQTTLFITASTSVYRIETKTTGLPMFRKA